MFVSSVENISFGLENIHININKMQPRPNKLPLPAQDVNMPTLEVTTPGGQQKVQTGSPSQEPRSWLLRPQHEIPSTPPPRSDRSDSVDLFPRRVNT